MGLLDYVKDILGLAKPISTQVNTPINNEFISQITSIIPAKQEEFSVIPKQPIIQATTEFNPGDFISSQEFTNVDGLSEAQIQEFFVSKDSFLKEYVIKNQLISYWIYKNCQENGLNPKIVLTHAQKEQALISQKTLPTKQRRIDYALGVGATDGGDNPKWKGMDQQFLGATLTCMRWYNKGEKENKYPLIFPASDNPNLVINNSAVFSLYKFTPWIGNQDKLIGKVLYKSPFGNFLFYKIYKKWFS
jgi:hypothetical protein